MTKKRDYENDESYKNFILFEETKEMLGIMERKLEERPRVMNRINNVFDTHRDEKAVSDSLMQEGLKSKSKFNANNLKSD